MRPFEPMISSESKIYFHSPSAHARRMFFYPICVGRYIYKPGYRLVRKKYDSYLIMLIESGECMVEIQNKCYSAVTGDAVFIDCYYPHAYSFPSGCTCLWIHFDGTTAGEYSRYILENYGNVIHLAQNHLLKDSLQEIFSFFEQNNGIKEALLSRNITTILTEIMISPAASKPQTRQSLMIEETLSYINEHLTENITLEELAGRIALSPFYFTRIFKKETGYTPHEYLIHSRINKSKFLLKTTDYSIKEIAFSSGFGSESRFCISFKQLEGITPTKYREEC